MTGASLHDDIVTRLLWADAWCDPNTAQAALRDAADEITRLRARVRDLDQTLSDAEHRLTWGRH
jgi:hypothetical protein